MLSLEAMVAVQFTAQRQETTAFNGLLRLRSSSCVTSLIVPREAATAQLGKCPSTPVLHSVPVELLLISREHIVLAHCLAVVLICRGCFHCLRFLGLFCLHRQTT